MLLMCENNTSQHERLSDKHELTRNTTKTKLTVHNIKTPIHSIKPTITHEHERKYLNIFVKNIPMISKYMSLWPSKVSLQSFITICTERMSKQEYQT